MIEHLPRKQQWQKQYREFRHKGEDSLHALQHTFNFMMEDDENLGWLASRSKQRIME